MNKLGLAIYLVVLLTFVVPENPTTRDQIWWFVAVLGLCMMQWEKKK